MGNFDKHETMTLLQEKKEIVFRMNYILSITTTYLYILSEIYSATDEESKF